MLDLIQAPWLHGLQSVTPFGVKVSAIWLTPPAGNVLPSGKIEN